MIIIMIIKIIIIIIIIIIYTIIYVILIYIYIGKLMERCVCFVASQVMFDDTLIDDEQMFISKIGETTPTTSWKHQTNPFLVWMNPTYPMRWSWEWSSEWIQPLQLRQDRLHVLVRSTIEAYFNGHRFNMIQQGGNLKMLEETLCDKTIVYLATKQLSWEAPGLWKFMSMVKTCYRVDRRSFNPIPDVHHFLESHKLI